MAVRPIDRPCFALMAPQVGIEEMIFVAKKIKYKKPCKITRSHLERNKTATLVWRGFASPAKNLRTDVAADVCDYICRRRFIDVSHKSRFAFDTLTFDGLLTATGWPSADVARPRGRPQGRNQQPQAEPEVCVALMTRTRADCSGSSTDLALLAIDQWSRAHANGLLKRLHWLMQENEELHPQGGDVEGEDVTERRTLI